FVVAPYVGHASLSDDSWAQGKNGDSAILPVESSGPTFGLRVLYFDADWPWVELGISYNQAALDGDFGRVSIVRVLPMAHFGIPLWRDEQIPAGRLRPYFTFGLGVAHGAFTPAADLLASFRQDDASLFGLGLELGAGLALQPWVHTAFFVEYQLIPFSSQSD